ncbi:MAG: NAD-dependent malic enzyme [Alphaproteobacteria bacterium]|nr:NAD-dependent malic enzyme [Alphaproteobacteria bacterium]
MAENGDFEILTSLTGYELLTDPLLNKGTAFTDEERDDFGLHGLLPPSIGTLNGQIRRRMRALREFATDLERYAFLRELQDTNETLFYALLAGSLEELMPLVYTPTVGLGCEHFSRVFRTPRGVFLSPPNRHRIAQILANPRFDSVESIVVTDGERILGLGDQGAGGMGIPIGKLALYTACGGIHPRTTLPVMLDVGTDNEDRLADPLYVGWRSPRIRGDAYDAFIEDFVAAVTARWPHVLLQWEDFAKANATRLLERYRDRLCTFNDDIQGTAAVATGALLAAINVTGVPLKDQRIAVFGAGSAGSGIAALLHRAIVDSGVDAKAASRQFYLIDRYGLLVEGMNDIQPFQRPFVQPRGVADGWNRAGTGGISLLDVARNAGITTLIGVSAQAGAFTRDIVDALAAKTPRPVIFPLSNPTSKAEATPQDLADWTAGRAVVGTGSPFPPVRRGDAQQRADQTNNSYIFPGVALGTIAVRARRISDDMFLAAAKALAALSPALSHPGATLLPPVAGMRDISFAVAQAVARQARREGLAGGMDDDQIDAAIQAKMWKPAYHHYRRVAPPEDAL